MQWFPISLEKPVPLRIRALFVDGRIKEYVLGSPHEITDRQFVVRRVFRINDSLPAETGSPRWQWQRGGWLLVDRTTGRISPLTLPEFDFFYSSESWFRDYVAYCGVSEDGKKIFAVVAQVSRHKPVLKNPLSNVTLADEAGPDSACTQPTWQRSPTRVTFDVPGSSRQTYAIRGRVVDLVTEVESDEEEGSK